MIKSTIAFLVTLLSLQGAFADLICEELPVQICSYSIASSGKRCLLETSAATPRGLQCKTSQVMATSMRGYIEGDGCINACGLDRVSVGISSDSLLDDHFTSKLCSPQCYDNCPNIVDLYNNLAQAEGVYLSETCKTEGMGSHRVMFQLQSSGAAYGPISAATADAPMSVDCAPPPM